MQDIETLNFTSLLSTLSVSYDKKACFLDSGAQLALEDLVRQVEKTGKSGSITIKIGIESDGRGLVKVKGQLDTKIPLPVTMPTPLFVTKQGELTLEDPDQDSLPGIGKMKAVK